LQLEYSWIKEFDPRFNVKYRDDKSYPWLAVTVGEEFPRVMVGRGAKKKGTRYFGPYAHAWAIRETVDTLLRVFPMRSCSNGVFTRSKQIGRPCLLGYIGKCAAPCVGRVSADEHRAIVDDFCSFIAGQTSQHIKRLEREMKAASATMEYERAARLRDDIGALTRAMEQNAVVLADGTDADVIAVAEDPLEIAVQLFHVRGGRVRGQRGWVADRVDDSDLSELLREFLIQVYDEETGPAIPREVLVPATPSDDDTLVRWLSDKRGRWPATPASRWPCTRRSEPAISRRAPGRWRRSSRPSSYPRHHSGSSATTCPTCRAPRSSRRWWSSRTVCPGRATTGGS
jgi:excinuclease ABC subunit C